MKLRLADTIYSSQDLTALILEIREYARWFSHNSIKKHFDAGHVAEPSTLSGAAGELIRDWGVKKPVNSQSLDDLIVALEEIKHSVPSLTITLAAPPASDLKKTLVVWCRNNIASNILVNFQFNATLLGGMVVRYGSHVLDLSFRRKILAAREHFPEVLRRV